MNFLHYKMGNVSRSTGRSVVQAVAYITRQNLFEMRRELSANYSRIDDHQVFWETLAPEGSGIDKTDLSIWDKADLAEDEILSKRHRDPEIRAKKINAAVTSYSDRVALPIELTREQNIELMREFILQHYVARGLVATYSMHWQEGNPHAHFIYSARQYVEGEFSVSKAASRETRGPQGSKETREILCNIINKHQLMAGCKHIVSPLSYKDQGLDQIPTRHKGYKSHQLEREGRFSRIGQENEQISEDNKQRIIEYPSIILQELTKTHATFDEDDVLSIIQKKLKDDVGNITQHVFHAVMKEAVEVGRNIFDETRYTSQKYHEKEAKVLESLESIQGEKATLKITDKQVEEELKRLNEGSKDEKFKPNEGQLNAIRTLCGDSQLQVMVGRAGTGKTTTLKSVVRLHQDAGYKVIGMAPSATAAAQLEADTSCKSDTIAHSAYYWKLHEQAIDKLKTATTDKEMREAKRAVDQYQQHLPDSHTLIIIDEVGMVGVGDRYGDIAGGWDAIIDMVLSTGAKLILSGDDHQYKPVEAGDIFRRLIQYLRDTNYLCELKDIVRQNIPWMREASNYLAELNVSEALGLYENHGHIQEFTTRVDVYEDMARQYVRNITSMPDSKGMVIAATNKECDALNREIRSLLKQNGLLPQQDHFVRGEDRFTIGDRIVFTKNDRGFRTEYKAKNENFFVQNSMQAAIKQITPITIRDKETGKKINTHEFVAHVPDHDATVKFNSHNYKGFAHGYAVTGHKSQGATLDWVLAKLSRFMDAHALYVILTRHREEISLYYSNEDFKNYSHLVYSLSKVNVKDLVVDYSISDEKKEYWQNVQDYKDAGRELTVLRAHRRMLDKTDKDELRRTREDYQYVEEDRKSWAKFILENWDEHKDFVRQAGLTRESIEIAGGFKNRTLSRLELQAQIVVEQYVATAFEAREFWREIRRTHPGIRAKTHPLWNKFKDVTAQRGVLANQIAQNPILYRPFLKEAATNLDQSHTGYVPKSHQRISYSLATIRLQAETHQSKMVYDALLKDHTKPAQQDMLKILGIYIEHRDMHKILWQDMRPKLKDLDGTLLKDSYAKEVDELAQVQKKRDAAAGQMIEKQGAFEELAQKIGVKLDLEKLTEQAHQAKRDQLVDAYKNNPEQMTKLAAAHELFSLIKTDAEIGKKHTLSTIYRYGMTPKEIATSAHEYQKIKLYEGLKSEPERQLFLLLDEYDGNCRKANDLYALCVTDAKDKKEMRPWHSVHYEAYKKLCESRNSNALEIFDQRDYNQVMAMAEAMGIKFNDIELSARGEQGTRSRNIQSYLNSQDLMQKGEAAKVLAGMISYERREGQGASMTERQVYYAGINLRELQDTVYAYQRATFLQSLTSKEEMQVFHGLQDYVHAITKAKSAYKNCIKESHDRKINPWETTYFKEYLDLVKSQDEMAYKLNNTSEASVVAKVAQGMGISLKGLDVDAHRHSLRITIGMFMDGDRTNVPMAAKELLNWLEFDRHSNYKHTFKVLREQDLWPEDLKIELRDFFAKKRELRSEIQQTEKQVARSIKQGLNTEQPKYKIITYERYQSYAKVENKLKERIYELATFVLGEPLKGSRRSDYFTFKKQHKVSVAMRGPKQGVYMNFVTGVKGGPLKLIEDQMGLTSSREAKEWAIDWLGGNTHVIEHKIIENKSHKKASTWVPVIPVPKDASQPDIEGNKYLNYMLRDGNKEVARYAYCDEQGNLQGYVFRFERPKKDDPEGKRDKVTLPLAFCENEKGFRCWKWQGFFGDEKTAYGVEKLAQDPTKPVLVVEGEKKADIAQKMLPDYHVLSWIGGAGSVGKTNWECLIDKQVIIWPDNDKGGHIAAQTLQKIVNSLNQEKGGRGRVGIVSLPESLPEKWDLADALPEGWSLNTVRTLIKDAIAQKSVEDRIDLAITAVQITDQDAKILAYLQDEVKTNKHTWLRENFARKLLAFAQENPQQALKDWQEVSGDLSFSPATTQATELNENNSDSKSTSIEKVETEETFDSGIVDLYKKKKIQEKFTTENIHQRIEKLQLDKKGHYPQVGIEKLAENIFISLAALHKSYGVPINRDKIVDQSLYIAMRMQQGNLGNEIDELKFINQICLESKYFIQNTHQAFNEINKKAEQKLKFLGINQLKNKSKANVPYESSQIENSQFRIEFYKQLLGPKSNISPETLVHMHEFEKCLKDQMDNYKKHLVQNQKQMENNQQKHRSFQYDL